MGTVTRLATFNDLQQQINGLADVVAALAAGLRISGPDGRKIVDDAFHIVQSYDHSDYPDRPNRAARKAIVAKLAGDACEIEIFMRDWFRFLEEEREARAAREG